MCAQVAPRSPPASGHSLNAAVLRRPARRTRTHGTPPPGRARVPSRRMWWWPMTLVLLGIAAPAASAATPLQRFAPVVVHDSGEQSPLTGVKAYAGVVPGVPEGTAQPTAYGR